MPGQSLLPGPYPWSEFSSFQTTAGFFHGPLQRALESSDADGPGVPYPVENPAQDEPVLMGIMAEILTEEFRLENIKIPFLEFPALSPNDTVKINEFWGTLERSVKGIEG